MLHPLQGDLGEQDEPDLVIMNTKLKILEIFQFIMNVRLDLRITNLLVVYRREFKALEKELLSPPSETSLAGLVLFPWSLNPH